MELENNCWYRNKRSKYHTAFDCSLIQFGDLMCCVNTSFVNDHLIIFVSRGILVKCLFYGIHNLLLMYLNIFVLIRWKSVLYFLCRYWRFMTCWSETQHQITLRMTIWTPMRKLLSGRCVTWVYNTCSHYHGQLHVFQENSPSLNYTTGLCHL